MRYLITAQKIRRNQVTIDGSGHWVNQKSMTLQKGDGFAVISFAWQQP